MQTILNKSQTTKISIVFFEGVTVQHPLTVINNEFSEPFLNFPNRFFMKKDLLLKICQHLNVWNGM